MNNLDANAVIDEMANQVGTLAKEVAVYKAQVQMLNSQLQEAYAKINNLENPVVESPNEDHPK